MTVTLDSKGRMLAELVHDAWDKIKPNKQNVLFQSGRSTTINPRDVTYSIDLEINNSIDDIPEMIIGPSLSRPKDPPTRLTRRGNLDDGQNASQNISIEIIEDLGRVLEWHRKNRRKSGPERELFRKGHLEVHPLYGIVSGRRHPKLAEAEANPSDSEELDMFGEV